MFTPHELLIRSFLPQIVMRNLLGVRDCSRCWRYSCEQGSRHQSELIGLLYIVASVVKKIKQGNGMGCVREAAPTRVFPSVCAAGIITGPQDRSSWVAVSTRRVNTWTHLAQGLAWRELRGCHPPRGRACFSEEVFLPSLNCALFEGKGYSVLFSVV